MKSRTKILIIAKCKHKIKFGRKVGKINQFFVDFGGHATRNDILIIDKKGESKSDTRIH
jgi:hypothetical protein